MNIKLFLACSLSMPLVGASKAASRSLPVPPDRPPREGMRRERVIEEPHDGQYIVLDDGDIEHGIQPITPNSHASIQSLPEDTRVCSTYRKSCCIATSLVAVGVIIWGLMRIYNQSE